MQDFTWKANRLEGCGPKLSTLDHQSIEPHIDGREGSIEDQIYRAGYCAIPCAIGNRIRIFEKCGDTRPGTRLANYHWLIRAGIPTMTTVFVRLEDIHEALRYLGQVIAPLEPILYSRTANEAEQLRFDP